MQCMQGNSEKNLCIFAGSIDILGSDVSREVKIWVVREHGLQVITDASTYQFERGFLHRPETDELHLGALSGKDTLALVITHG